MQNKVYDLQFSSAMKKTKRNLDLFEQEGMRKMNNRGMKNLGLEALQSCILTVSTNTKQFHI